MGKILKKMLNLPSFLYDEDITLLLVSDSSVSDPSHTYRIVIKNRSKMPISVSNTNFKVVSKLMIDHLEILIDEKNKENERLQNEEIIK